MFQVILKAELKHIFTQAIFYALWIGTLLLSYILFIGNSGFFDGPSEGFQVWVNGTYEIHLTGIYLTKLILFYLPIFVGGAVYRDYSENAYSILYSYPIQKWDLYFGKFTAGFIAVVIIAIFSALVPLWAIYTPGLDPGKIGPIQWRPVLSSIFYYEVPTLILGSGIVFAVVSITRNIYSGFIAILILFLFQVFTENSLTSGSIIALLDPFAQNTISYLTQHWTIVERNEMLLPLTSLLLFNRVGVIILGICTLLLGLKLFELHELPVNLSLHRGKTKPLTRPSFKSAGTYKKDHIDYSDGIIHQLRITWASAKIDIKYILKNRIFLLLTIVGLLSLVFMVLKLTDRGDMVILPVTHMIISVPAFFYGMTILILTFILSGMVYQRSRNDQMDALIESTGVSNASLFASKVLSLWVVQLILLSIMMVVGLGIQVYHNFYSFELPLYLFHILGVLFPGLALWAIVSIAVQHFSGKPFIGIIILFGMWIGTNGMSQIGIDTALLTFNQDEPITYSQVNGYGDALYSFYLVKIYWACAVALLVFLALSTWRRGYLKEVSILSKLSSLRTQHWIIALLILIIFVVSGGIIWNEEKSTFSAVLPNPGQYYKEASLNIEHYLPLHQPKIEQINMVMDIYPKKRSFKAQGRYTIINPYEKEIDTVVVRSGFDEITTIEITNAMPIYNDSILQWTVYKLRSPLGQGDSLFLDFSIVNKPNTAFERNSPVLSNGTFIKSDVLPRLGIPRASNNELNHGHYQGSDSDLLGFDCTISTNDRQIPITQGEQIKTWTSSERRYAHFQTKMDMKFGFSFHSGAYEHISIEENDLKVNAYFVNEHQSQIQAMVAGIHSAIEYNTQHFSTYGHHEVTLIEFPNSEGSYATAFGNVLPVSEVRFIVDNSRTDKGINLGFYVSAHEVTHHWWGNQLMPAHAPGAHMLTESITEYCTYQIYKSKYGNERALDFIQLQHKRYFEGRRKNRKPESPLTLVGENETYVSYGKGAIALRTLAHFCGENQMNASLQSLLKEFKYSGKPYPTTQDLLCIWYESVPDSLLPIVENLFNTTSVLDLAIEKINPLDDEYVHMDISAEGLEGLGKKVWVTAGFYAESTKIGEQMIEVSEGNNNYEIQIPKQTNKIVLDPGYYLLDQNRSNNSSDI